MGGDAIELLRETLRWLRATWWEHEFFIQRDIAWTVQKRLLDKIAARQLRYRVYHNYTMPNSKRVSFALVDYAGRVALAVEFQYEPDHKRTDDFTAGKLDPSVVDWNDSVGRDVKRVREFVRRGLANRAVSVFFDEGGHFHHRDPHPGSGWDSNGPFPILISEYPRP